MTGHIPVLVREVVDALQPAGGERYLDGTFGGGGYTAAILDKADCRVIALDRDPDARLDSLSLPQTKLTRTHRQGPDHDQANTLARSRSVGGPGLGGSHARRR